MIEYATLWEVKKYCRIQHSALDDTLQLLIYACSSAVKNYLKSASAYEVERNTDDAPILDSSDLPEVIIDSNDCKTVRAEVQLAVMYWVDLRLKNPSSEDPNGEPPAVVKNLLYPLRQPALA